MKTSKTLTRIDLIGALLLLSLVSTGCENRESGYGSAHADHTEVHAGSHGHGSAQADHTGVHAGSHAHGSQEAHGEKPHDSGHASAQADHTEVHAGSHGHGSAQADHTGVHAGSHAHGSHEAHGEKPHDSGHASAGDSTRIDPVMAESFGVETEVAGPATLTKSVTVYGRVRVNPERAREIRARFDGQVHEVQARVGDLVREGQKLVSVESNESLNRYWLLAPISGVVTSRDINSGEQTNGRLLMTITDTSSVWVDLSVFPIDREGVVIGSRVSIAPALGGRSVEGVVSLLETFADPHDQTAVARVVLENPGNEIRPGTFVSAEVRVGEFEVPVAVKQTGLQTQDGTVVVYTRHGDLYHTRPLEIGRQVGEWAEVLDGLAPGVRYVTVNSHLIKADIEKSGAAHHH